MSEQHPEGSDEDARSGAIPGGGGDSQYGNDTGFADEALGGEPAAPAPDAQHEEEDA